jgi:hypothetical protein
VTTAYLAVAALLAAGARPALAEDQGKQAIVVLPLTLVGRVPAGRPALEAAVAKGIAVAARPIVGADEVRLRYPASRSGACDGPSCWREVGQALDAGYLVSGVVERRGGLFHASFRLIEPGGRELATEANECDENECSVAELCRMTARELVRQTLAGKPADAPAPPEAAPPPVVRAPASAISAAPAPPQRRSGGKVLGIAALAAGAVSLGIGAYYLKNNGCERTIDNECKVEHHYLGGSLALLGAGAALVATGVVLLVRSPGGGASATAALGPGGLLVAGRF